MISIKTYLDAQSPASPISLENAGSAAQTVECYLSLLRAIGKSVVQASPTLGKNLEQHLQGLERRLSVTLTSKALQETQTQAEVQLLEWGKRAAEHFNARADEIKELLLVLAQTAESVVNRDQRQTTQLNSLTEHLNTIATFDDLTKVRSSLVKHASELKQYVVQTARENSEVVSQLRATVNTYHARLQEVEQYAFTDPLTGVANRRALVDRIQSNIVTNQTFCIVVIDLNEFKPINDQYGHLAGDDLLKQFASQLQKNIRSFDLVGRSGGDEFMVILQCNAVGARAYINRIEEWALGDYTVKTGKGSTVRVRLDAALGMAQWQFGYTADQVISAADTAMYEDKRKSGSSR